MFPRKKSEYFCNTSSWWDNYIKLSRAVIKNRHCDIRVIKSLGYLIAHLFEHGHANSVT